MFLNRTDAGRQLADHLTTYADRSDVIVLGLPRGGLEVAAEVAQRLSAPLDVMLVRKLGVPGHPELAMGAIAEGGVEVLDEILIAQLGVPSALVQQTAVRERLTLDARASRYRGGRALPSLRDRTVLLVDDGLATGATMEAAIMALRPHGPARIIVAVPVGATDSCARVGRLADQVVCLQTPEPFRAVGLWYADFSQTTDEEVVRLLARAGHPPPGPATSSGRQADVVAVVRRRAVPLHGDPSDYDALVDQLGQARAVLLGEASHGTHEFYRERIVLTKRLIAEKGFAAVAVEADWPDAYRVNCYARGTGADADATEALGAFRRFPMWMWRNADVLDFVGWLREHNDARPPAARVGFYGLDLYSLDASMAAVLAYLDKVDPQAARVARLRYGCFEQYGRELETYAYGAGSGLTPSCEHQVVAQLREMHERRADYLSNDGLVAADEFFYAEQNARLVSNAEAYYRAMLHGRAEAWNLRDRHMAETLRQLVTHLEHQQPSPRVVVWAHNSHLGDARATELGDRGEINLGQLVRQRLGGEAMLVGFTTHSGTVTAASRWDGPTERKTVRPSLPGSYEHLFHETGLPRFVLPLRTDLELAAALAPARLERAIGVIYSPATERQSHYFRAHLPKQFDAVLHIDHTRAVEPIERMARWHSGEIAETYPSGL